MHFAVTYGKLKDKIVPVRKDVNLPRRLSGHASTVEEIQSVRHLVHTYAIDPGRRDWIFGLASQVRHADRPTSASEVVMIHRRLSHALRAALCHVHPNEHMRLVELCHRLRKAIAPYSLAHHAVERVKMTEQELATLVRTLIVDG